MLLEVIFATTLFVTTAAIVMLGTSRSLRAARNLQRDSQAADLAVTLLSEIQMGLVPPTDAGPEAYGELLEGWTWQVVASPVAEQLEETDIVRVEIIITHTMDGYTYHLAHLVPAEGDLPGEPAEPDEPVGEDPFALSGAGP